MDSTQSDSMTLPTYIIYRDAQPGQAYDPAASPVFYPPKDSDELFDALRAKYPHTATHSERMRNAVIEFLLEEREAEAAAASMIYTSDISQPVPDTTSPWTGESWPSISSSALSSPDMSSLGTPAFMTSPDQSTISKENSPVPLERMTSVFSLSTASQPKQRLRRKMTEAEKADYRQRRLMKACDKCAKRKRKCTHNQAAKASGSITKSTRTSVSVLRLQQHEAIAAEAGSGSSHQGVPDAVGQAPSVAGPFHTETQPQGFNDFTLLFDEPMPDIDYENMLNTFADIDSDLTDNDMFTATQVSADASLLHAHPTRPSNVCGNQETISPTLLDATTRNVGQIRLHTLQDQARQRNEHVEQLQNMAQAHFEPAGSSSCGDAADFFDVSISAVSKSPTDGTTSTSPSPSSAPCSDNGRFITTVTSGANVISKKRADKMAIAPDQSTRLSIFDDSLDRKLSNTSAELFMLRRGSSALNPIDFSRLITPRSELPIDTTALDARIAARPAFMRALQVYPLQLPVDAVGDESTDADASDVLQTPLVQHVGRLTCHNRYRDHHGRRSLPTPLQVICSLLALVWLCCLAGPLALVAVISLAFTGFREQAATKRSASGLSRVVKGLTSRSTVFSVMALT